MTFVTLHLSFFSHLEASGSRDFPIAGVLQTRDWEIAATKFQIQANMAEASLNSTLFQVPVSFLRIQGNMTNHGIIDEEPTDGRDIL